MKYVRILSILLLGLLAACSEAYLDRAPLDTINTANYPTNAEELITVVNGAYQPLQWPKRLFGFWCFETKRRIFGV